MHPEWAKATEWERQWWAHCANTFGEEFKQLLYARKMGLKTFHDGKSPFNFDLEGKSVVDIGGGPCSLLLKCRNVRGVVVDPCRYPAWVYGRYIEAGIKINSIPAEQLEIQGIDEAWIYNCLQHTQDPKEICRRARQAAKIIRVFEWIDTGTSEGHLHNLTEALLNEWLGGEGKVERVNENTAAGLAYYGIFRGANYGS